MRKLNPTRFIFVVGTPGAGKSTFCRELAILLESSGFESSSHGDYPFLRALFASDMAARKYNRFKPDPNAEFIITNSEVYDEALKEIYDNVLSDTSSTKQIRIIEFSRPKYDTAFLYYTLNTLGESLIVKISADFDTCNLRNERRRTQLERKLQGGDTQAFSEDPDLHYVPEAVMKNFYAKDLKDASIKDRDQNLVLSLLPTRGFIEIFNGHEDRDGFRITARQIIRDNIINYVTNSETFEDYYLRRHEQLSKYFRTP